ncbi:Hypothetical_protein [Hexamita inflata]|uniref:Hypothetical_protein n=1 Tax=Hexamita inflata TaxID=28002 RepID=A0AA86U4P5_9EUKA|nr:Hypothetical protein HINF_LOCUS25457 [Hexamita inflata]
MSAIDMCTHSNSGLLKTQDGHKEVKNVLKFGFLSEIIRTGHKCFERELQSYLSDSNRIFLRTADTLYYLLFKRIFTCSQHQAFVPQQPTGIGAGAGAATAAVFGQLDISEYQQS